MQTWRWTELLQMLKVTTIGGYSHCLADVFFWELFPDGLQCNLQLVSRLSLRVEFMVLFQYGAPDMTVQRVQIWRAVLHDAWTLRNGGCLGWNSINLSFVDIISTKPGGKERVLLFNSSVKFHAKICMHCWNINKSPMGYFLWSSDSVSKAN